MLNYRPAYTNYACLIKSLGKIKISFEICPKYWAHSKKCEICPKSNDFWAKNKFLLNMPKKLGKFHKACLKCPKPLACGRYSRPQQNPRARQALPSPATPSCAASLLASSTPTHLIIHKKLHRIYASIQTDGAFMLEQHGL